MKFNLARDPVIYSNLVAALVMFVSTFVFNLSPEVQGSVNALAVFLAGAVGAAKTADGQLALAIGALKGLLAIGIGFGLHISDGQQLVIMTLAVALGAAFVRTQVAPATAPPLAVSTTVRVADPVRPGSRQNLGINT